MALLWKCVGHMLLLPVSRGEDFTFRHVSGPGRTDQRIAGLSADSVFETVFGPQSFCLPSPLYKHQKDYMID